MAEPEGGAASLEARIAMARKIGIVGDNAHVDNMQIQVVEPAPSRPPDLVPPAERHPLVGRDALIEDLKATLRQGGASALLHLPGVGKRSLALHLAYDPDLRDHFSGGVLWASLGPDPDILATLGLWAEASGVSFAELSQLTTTEQRREEVEARVGSRSKVLIVIDDVWKAEDARPFLLGGLGAAHLVTTRIPAVAADLIDEIPSAFELPELSAEDGLALLAWFAPGVAREEEQALRSLVEALGGLPLGIVLAGKRLARDERTKDPQRWKATLAGMRDAHRRLGSDAGNDGPPESLWATIKMSEEGLPDEGSRLALRRLSVFRPKPSSFTAEAAGAVCGVEAAMVYDLADHGLLEDAGPGRYSMHRAVADYASAQLPDEERRQLNSSAASHYGGVVSSFEDASGASAYQLWYRYEDPGWQEAKTAWLYHLERSGQTGAACLALATVYIDAFWWWGSYIEFPFCRRWLDGWEQARLGAESGDWLDALNRFHRAWPPEAESRPGARGDWSLVEKALLDLQGLAGLSGDASSLDPAQRHLLALTDVFLGQSYRGRDPADPRIEASFQSSLALLRNDGDDWNCAWVLLYLGDLRSAQGDLEGSLAACSQALEIAAGPVVNSEDHELEAGIRMVQAEVYWSKGRMEPAFALYSLAAVHALAFQVVPHGPDPYTVTFYRRTKEAIASRLAELHSLSPGQSAEAVRSLRAAWAGTWEPASKDLEPDEIEAAFAGDLKSLADILFPPGPSPPGA